MLKTKWYQVCLDHRHHIARGERIACLINEGDSGNRNKLICDNCGDYKSWKAVTDQKTVWCRDCLPPHNETYWWVNINFKRNNRDEEIKQALWKEFRRQYDINSK